MYIHVYALLVLCTHVLRTQHVIYELNNVGAKRQNPPWFIHLVKVYSHVSFESQTSVSHCGHVITN